MFQKAVEWLESQDDVQLKKLYQKLLDNHGHRCLSELELREESWSEDPTKLVTVLQVSFCSFLFRLSSMLTCWR